MVFQLQEKPVDNSTPSISHRSSIAWQSLDRSLAERPPSSEDSAVLVLSSRSYLPSNTTSPASLLQDDKDAGNDSLPVLMYIDLRLSLPLSPTSVVSWAFAGLRHTLHADLPTYRWDHHIDSRGSGDVDDMGVTMMLDSKEVEVGQGLNPDSGLVERYFETWRSVFSWDHHSGTFHLTCILQ